MATWAETGFVVDIIKTTESYTVNKTVNTGLKWGTIGNQSFQKVLVGEMRVVKDIFQFWG